jgi:hypothetical protein
VKHTRIIVTHYGGPEALQVLEEERPEPKRGDMRVRVLAAGVSLADLMMREGMHPETPRVPFTPGWDLVGLVDRLGDRVSGIEPGQFVAALPIASPGLLKRYVVSIRALGFVTLAGYVLTIFAANLAITYLGIVPVGLGLMAPAGVYFAGMAFSLRDALQETLGRRWVVIAILIGAAISAALSAQLALASGLAFLFSELADFVIYTPLRQRNWLGAVVASNTVGVVIDSALFLWLAFGSFEFLPGQIVGKLWMTALTVVILLAWRRIAGRATREA